MFDANNLQITDNLFIRVNVGPFGKYVQLYRADRWFSFSLPSWKSFVDNLPAIKRAVGLKTAYGLSLTATKTITVSQFKGFPYINLAESYQKAGQECMKYINMNERQWEKFHPLVPEVNKLLEQHIAYQGTDNSWSLLKPTEMANVRFALVPRIQDDELNMFVAAHLIENDIKEQCHKNCKKCEDAIEVCDCGDACDIDMRHFHQHVDETFQATALRIPIQDTVLEWNEMLGAHFDPWSYVKLSNDVRKYIKRDIALARVDFPELDIVLRNTARHIKERKRI